MIKYAVVAPLFADCLFLPVGSFKSVIDSLRQTFACSSGCGMAFGEGSFSGGHEASESPDISR